MAGTEVFYTSRGYKSCLEIGLVNALKSGFVSVIDFNKNYLVTGNTIPVVYATGNKLSHTNEHCTQSSNIGGVNFPLNISVSEAENNRVITYFVGEDCDGGLNTFEIANLNIIFDISIYINNILKLLDTPYSEDIQASKIPIWKYLLAKTDTYNFIEEVWEPKKQNGVFNLIWEFENDEYKNNWELLNGLNYTQKGSRKKLVREDNRYQSPGGLFPTTDITFGSPVQGAGLTWAMTPSYYLYKMTDINNVTTITKTKAEGERLIEQHGKDFYNTVLFGAHVAGPNGGKNYYMTSSMGYRFKYDPIWYQLRTWESDDGEKLGLGLIQALILAMKTIGKKTEEGTYVIPINLKIITKADSAYNAITNKSGGSLKLQFLYNPYEIKDGLNQIIKIIN